MNGKDRGEGQVIDRGVVGWYRVFELTGEFPDNYRVGENIRYSAGTYRIVKVAAKVVPEHGGVTVCAEIVRECLMKSLRVGFAGASGTGKSTLARIVGERFRIPVNPVGSREVAAAMGLSSPYEADEKGLRAVFQRRLLEEKCGWEAEHDNFSTDRTTLDNMLYAMLHDVSSVDEETISRVRVGLSRYTHVIYCPVASFCKVGDDPARAKSAAYQEVYDAALYGLLMRYVNDAMPDRRPFYCLGAGDVATRAQHVVTWIAHGGL